MHFTPFPSPGRNGITISTAFGTERHEAPSESPTLPPSAPDRNTAKGHFSRSTISAQSTSSPAPPVNGANLSVSGKQLLSSVSTYDSTEDDNELALQSNISTDSEDTNTSSFIPFGRRTRADSRDNAECTVSSICVVGSFDEGSRHNRSASISTQNANPTARNSVNGATTHCKTHDGKGVVHRRPSPYASRSRQHNNPPICHTNEAFLSSACHRPSASPLRLSFSQRLSKDIELSRELDAACPELTLYAFEEEAPVALEVSGVRCCPHLRRCVAKGRGKGRAGPGKRQGVGIALTAEHDEDINLSPFKTWDFTRFLPQAAEDAPASVPAGKDKRQPSRLCPTNKAERMKKNTLCLDLDETLVHTSLVHMADADAIVRVNPTETEGDCTYELFVKYRPFLREFLEFSLKHFEVVIFTASKKYYAKAILARLQADYDDLFWFYAPDDEEGDGAATPAATQRQKRADNCIILLHRDHCTPTNAGFVKDLFLLGRDLRTCFIVDNSVCCGSFQPFNLLHVKDFARSEREVASEEAEETCVRVESASSEKKGNMDQAKLKELKGFRTSSASGSVSMCESTYLWEDPNDTVLLDLISADRAILHGGTGGREYSGLLMDLAVSRDVPTCLLHSMTKSIEKMERLARKQQR